MAIPKRIIRGVANIHTHSDNSDSAFRPYKAYLRVACLEMERARRGKERQASLFRVGCIDAREQEIEDEKAKLLSQVGENNGDQEADSTKTKHVSAQAKVVVNAGSTVKGAFKIRY